MTRPSRSRSEGGGVDHNIPSYGERPKGVQGYDIKSSPRLLTELLEPRMEVTETITAVEPPNIEKITIPVSITFNLQEENNMNNSRRVVTVQLIDDDTALEVKNSVVATFIVVTEDPDNITIQELILNEDIKGKLETHNNKRKTTQNLDILERTGSDVKLRPVKLKDLRWVVK